MSARIPEDAFAFYVALGAERSYQAVAEHFDVSKRAVVKVASRDAWATRLAAIEAKTRELTAAKLAESLHEMDLRHRRLLRAVASRAAKAISDYPLASGMEGIRAAEIAIKLERVLAGEPSERSSVTVAEVTRQEMDRFLAPRTAAAESDDEEVDW